MGRVSRYQEASGIFEVQCLDISVVGYLSVTSSLEAALLSGRELPLECRETTLPFLPLPSQHS